MTMCSAITDINTFFFDTVAQHESGNLALAESNYHAVLKQYPQHSGALHYLGLIRHQEKKDEEAIAFLNEAAQISPEIPVIHYNLGCVYQSAKKIPESIESLKLAIKLDPKMAIAYSSLAISYLRLPDQKLATYYANEAIKLNPDLAPPYNTLVETTIGSDAERAMGYAKRALEIDPDLPESCISMGKALYVIRKPLEAEYYYRKAVTISSEFRDIHAAMVMNFCYQERLSNEELFEEHEIWASRYLGEFYPKAPVHFLSPERNNNGKLRIGYLSGDFGYHSVCYFFKPVLEKHNKGNFEITLFSTSPKKDQDENTAALKKLADHWVDISTESEENAYQIIKDRNIDILVELSGLTSKYRPATLARKPAPIIISYIGYPHSTGIETIDYRFVDNITDPAGVTDKLYTEKLIRLPDCFLCYQPRKNIPHPAELPFDKNGYITFGTFNNLLKISDSTIELWCKILNQVPNSKLMFKSSFMSNRVTAKIIMNQFIENGINSNRVIMHEVKDDHFTHLNLYNRMDISLDTYPYNGTTTTFESLLMGVPVISQCGTRHSSRVGKSILTNLGIEDLVANTDEEYFHKAVNLSGDIDRLRALKSNLRNMLQNSALCDAGRKTSKIEEVYTDLWKRYSNA